MIGIYIIENKIDNKVYIGKSIDLDIRLQQHRYALNRNDHVNKHLQNAWNKYSEHNFSFQILHECNESELDYWEIYYINKYDSNNSKFGYNLTSGGDGCIKNEEVKNKISVSKRGQGSTLSEDDVRHIKMLMFCMMDRNEISKMFNVSKKVLTQISMGKSFGYVCEELNDSIHNLKDTLIKERNDKILDLFDNSKGITDIAKIMNLSISIVEKCVYKYRNVVVANKSKYQEIYEKVLDLHNNGINNYQISKLLKISPSTVQRYLSGQNNPYKELNFKKIKSYQYEEIYKLYTMNNKNSYELAEIYDVSPTTIMSIINNYIYTNTEVSK